MISRIALSLVGLALLAVSLVLLLASAGLFISGVIDVRDRAMLWWAGPCVCLAGLCVVWCVQLVFGMPSREGGFWVPRWLHWLLWPLVPVLLPLVFATVLLLSPILLPSWTLRAFKDMRFRRRWAGHYFLIASRRRGWFEFITNNVEPVLPSNFIMVWDRPHRDMQFTPEVVLKLRGRSRCMSRP